MLSRSLLPFCLIFIIAFSSKAQNNEFEVRDQRNGELVNGSGTFYETTVSKGLYNHNFTIQNKGTSILHFYLTKTEAIRNIPAKGDSAFSRFCTTIRCYPSTILNETITLQPGETIVLGCEFDEAKKPGYSMIEYKLKNKETSNAVFLIMKYTGAVGISENFEGKLALQNLYPNPSQGSSYLNVYSLKSTKVELQILNSLGSLIRQELITLEAGQSQLFISTEDLPTGVYVVRLGNAEMLTEKKLMVQH